MKTQYYTATSLDGFIATEDDSIDWLYQLGDVGATGYGDFIKDVGALAMGSSTYQWVANYINDPAKEDVTEWLYEQPTWVFSSRKLEPVAGADLHFVSGEVRPVHDQMREAADGKNIWIVGGGDLVGQFHDAGLLDQLILQLGSVTLGKGKPLLPREIVFPPLTLTSVNHIGPGFVELRYDVPKASSTRSSHP